MHSPGFAEQLAAAGIDTHAFKGRDIINSVLSQMHGRGVAGDHGVSSVADLMVQMRLLLEETAGESLYACAYWPSIDSLSHIYGWDHPSVSAEFRAIFAQLESEFMARLSQAARQDTALFIVADHGQVVTPSHQEIYLEDHPDLQRMLFMKPAGEPRTAYLYTKHGYQDSVVDYICTNLGHAMLAIPAGKALDDGLLGSKPHASVAAERIGDVIVTMREGYVLLTEQERESAKKMRGRHGGVTRDEMIVPWIGFRLDA